MYAPSPGRLWTVLPLTMTHPQWDPVAFRLGPLQIHWYALMYLLGFAIGYVLLTRRLRHQPYARIADPKPWTREAVEDLLLYAAAGVIIGGRLGFCFFYQPGHYVSHPLDIVKLWEGGMSFHGGAIGVALALALYAKLRGRPFLQVTDLIVPAVPTGLAAGRFGNFINGELWGRPAPASLPWAMIFPQADAQPRHPSQLYEMALEGLLLAVLLWAYARRERGLGQVSAAFLFGYGVFRFVCEYFREPDSYLGLLGAGLSMGQWLCVPMIVAGVALWFWGRGRTQAPTEVAEPAEPIAPVAPADEPATTDATSESEGGTAIDSATLPDGADDEPSAGVQPEESSETADDETPQEKD